MKIDPNSPLYTPSLRGKRRKSSTGEASAFSGLLDAEEAEGAEEAEAPARIAPPPMVGGILSIQEVDERDTKRGRMIQRGHRMLDALEELRVSILLGEVPADRLEVIRTRMQEEKEQVADPQLRELMNQIEIRAAVELAKFGL